MAASVTARVVDAKRELYRLESDFRSWLANRNAFDADGQFSMQLSALERVIAAALAGTESVLKRAEEAEGLIAHEYCRRMERGIVWIRRVWSFFRVRFDQRGDKGSGVARLLAAADQVVWSCYAPPFRPEGKSPLLPSPLPYVEDRFSPFAVPRTKVPGDLRYDIDAPFLNEFLTRLPIPVLGLPPACVAQPHLLVLVAHESGHHVQFDLAPDDGLVKTFEGWLAAATEAPAGDDVGPRWRPWSIEIFADAWSVLMVGPAAVAALAALEIGGEGRMLKPARDYPSVYVRLALMIGLLRQLGVAVPPEARLGLDPEAACAGEPIVVDQVDLRAQLRADLDVVPRIASALATRPVLGTRTLPQIAGWRAAPFVESSGVRRWAREFLEAVPPQPRLTLEAPRLAIAGACTAWSQLDGYQEADRDAARASLRERILQAVIDSREPGLRAPQPRIDIDDLGQLFTARVLDAPDVAVSQP